MCLLIWRVLMQWNFSKFKHIKRVAIFFHYRHLIYITRVQRVEHRKWYSTDTWSVPFAVLHTSCYNALIVYRVIVYEVYYSHTAFLYSSAIRHSGHIPQHIKVAFYFWQNGWLASPLNILLSSTGLLKIISSIVTKILPITQEPA